MMETGPLGLNVCECVQINIEELKKMLICCSLDVDDGVDADVDVDVISAMLAKNGLESDLISLRHDCNFIHVYIKSYRFVDMKSPES